MKYPEKLKKLIFDRLEFHGIYRFSRWNGKKMPLLYKAGLALAAGLLMIAYAGTALKLGSKYLGISQWVKLEKI